jgi:hypothetical protein
LGLKKRLIPRNAAEVDGVHVKRVMIDQLKGPYGNLKTMSDPVCVRKTPFSRLAGQHSEWKYFMPPGVHASERSGIFISWTNLINNGTKYAL